MIKLVCCCNLIKVANEIVKCDLASLHIVDIIYKYQFLYLYIDHAYGNDIS